jgi:hypothetical protein
VEEEAGGEVADMSTYDSKPAEEYEFGRPFDMGPEDGEPEQPDEIEDDSYRSDLFLIYRTAPDGET